MSLAAFAQGAREGEFDTVVERYVAEGLRSNLALQSETLEVERAAAGARRGTRAILPEVSLQARYSRAEGGREFSIPLGSTLNPVYSTLNEMLAAQGQPAHVPADFRRHRSIPARGRAGHARQSCASRSMRRRFPRPYVRSARLLDASNFNRMAVARALRRDITIAYLDWLKARSSVEIVAASQALLRENLRVNESLFANGKITEDQVLRAKAELLDVEQQQREIENLATPGAQLSSTSC